MSQSDPLNIASRLRKLALLRRKHATALPLPMPTGRPDLEFVDAVDAFARWHAASPGDGQTAELIEDLRTLATFFTDAWLERRRLQGYGAWPNRGASAGCKRGRWS